MADGRSVIGVPKRGVTERVRVAQVIVRRHSAQVRVGRNVERWRYGTRFSSATLAAITLLKMGDSSARVAELNLVPYRQDTAAVAIETIPPNEPHVVIYAYPVPLD